MIFNDNRTETLNTVSDIIFDSDGNVANGFYRISFHGGQYEGPVVDGYMQGTGTAMYTGAWYNSLPQGHGKFISSTLSSYEGSFYRGYFEGYGTLTESDGSVFKGSFSHQNKHYFGTLKSSTSSSCGAHVGKYVGGWKDGVQVGYGIYTSHGKYRYTGGFDMDGNRYKCSILLLSLCLIMQHNRSGFGKMEFSNGQVYEGGFYENMFSGYGRLQWPNGTIYEGGFKRNRFHGQGKKLLSDGSVVYEGCYDDGKQVI
jgi:hypothetical protein